MKATSALDAKSEAEVRAALENLMQGRTVIAIAHRLTTLRGFDRIIKLDGGRIVSDLPPEQVFAQTPVDGSVSLPEPAHDNVYTLQAAE